MVMALEESGAPKPQIFMLLCYCETPYIYSCIFIVFTMHDSDKSEFELTHFLLSKFFVKNYSVSFVIQ